MAARQVITNKRAQARRRAEFYLEQERLQHKQQNELQVHHQHRRRRVEDREMADLVAALDRSQSSHFGIVKLSHLRLDQPFVADELLPRYLRGHWPRRTMTLLELAAFRNRDSVLAALLRAGADPTRRCSGEEEREENGGGGGGGGGGSGGG